MNRYAILLGKRPPPLKFSNTAMAPMNMVVNSAGELIASTTPTLGMTVYVNDTPIGVVSSFEPSSGHVIVNLNASYASSSGTYKINYEPER